MQNLLVIPGEAGQLDVGLSPALEPHEGLLWQDAENCIFKDGEVQSMRGTTQLVSTPAQVVLLEQQFATSIYVPDDKAQRVFAATATAIYARTATLLNNVYTTLTVASGLTAPPKSMATFGNFLAWTDAVGVAQLWKNGAGVSDLLSLMGNSRVELLRRLGPHLIALGIDDESEKLKWASADNPEAWVPLPENSAGDLNLRDLGSAIIAAIDLGPDLAIYAKDAMGVLQYIGAPLYFGFQRRRNDIGAVGPNAVCAAGKRNFGMSFSGFWETDGISAQYIDRPAVWQYIEANMNWAAAEEVVVFFWEDENLVVFSYPEGTSLVNNRSFGYNLQRGTWTFFSFGFRAGIERNVFDYPLVAKEGTGVRLLGAADASDEAAFVLSKPLSFGEESVYKHIHNVRFSFQGTPSVEFFCQETLDSVPESYYAASMERLITPLTRETPYWSCKISGTQWSISAMKIQGQPTGYVV